MFNLSIQALSFYKAIILASQVLLIYIGFVIVSAIDKYHYKGILWSALKAGNIWATIIGLVWITLTLPAVRWLWNALRNRRLRTDNVKKLI
jgi:hypothetical protein